MMRRPLGITDTTHYIKGVRLFVRSYVGAAPRRAADVPADCNNHLDLSTPLPSSPACLPRPDLGSQAGPHLPAEYLAVRDPLGAQRSPLHFH